MREEYTETVKGLSHPIKIREYLKNKLDFSTALIAKVKYDNVFLNGVAVHMRAMVQNGDEIRVVLPTEESENIPPIEMPLEIIYEDEDIIALNKPINMPVHPCRGNHLPTLASGLRHYFGRPFVFRSINRLDRDTSGIVLVAKNQLSAIRLCRQMAENHFRKIYYAIVVGVTEEEGLIDAPIARQSPDSLLRVVRDDGKRSITEYKRLQVYDNGTSLVKVTLHTGRTHQIRVHMAHIGHPLLNDFLYGIQNGDEPYRLHCAEITFTHPTTGEELTLTSKMPQF